MKTANTSVETPTAIKSITINVEELRAMLAEAAASGNVDKGEAAISQKITEKADRLRRQRELRRQRKELKQAQQTESADKTTTKTNSGSDTFDISLTKQLAKCILWIHNRRDALKSNATMLVGEILRYCPMNASAKSIRDAIALLLSISDQAAKAANEHLYAKYRLRPQTVTIRLR